MDDLEVAAWSLLLFSLWLILTDNGYCPQSCSGTHPTAVGS